MSKARIYARNLAANWMGHGASLVVMFFLSPFVVNTLGKTEYGIWSLLNVFMGYMGVLDLGIRASTGRHIILYLGKEDHDAVDETIRTSLGFFSVIGCLIVLIGVILGQFFPAAFSSVPPRYRAVTALLLPIMAANMWMTTFRGVAVSVLNAHERFELSRGVDLVTLALRAGGTIAALLAGYGLVGLCLVMVASNALGLGIDWFLAKRVYPRLRVWPFRLARGRLRELFGYGIPAFIGAISARIIGQTDLVIVGAAIGVSAVTVYSVGAMLVYYMGPFLGMISHTIFPSLQKSVARDEMGTARRLFFGQVRLAMLFGLPAFIGIMVFAKPFIRQWMLGPKFDEASVAGAAIVMAILAASHLATPMSSGAVSMLNALGHVKAKAAIAIAEALLNLGLSLLFVLVLKWGLAGVALGTLVSRAVFRAVVFPAYTCRKAGIRVREYAVQFGGRTVLVGGLFAGWCLAVRGLYEPASWPAFFGQVGLALAGYLPIGYYLVLTPDLRKRLWALVQPRGAEEQA